MTRREGGLKAAITNRTKTEMTINGVTVKIKVGQFYQMLGKSGGLTPKTKPQGFAAMPKHLVSAAGKKGGAISRRGPAQGKNNVQT